MSAFFFWYFVGVRVHLLARRRTTQSIAVPQDHQTRRVARAFSTVKSAARNLAAHAEAPVAAVDLVAHMLAALLSCQERDEGATSTRRLAFCLKVRTMRP